MKILIKIRTYEKDQLQAEETSIVRLLRKDKFDQQYQ